MKVTASEVFKGKKANYEPSIPVPFIPHRIGTKFVITAVVIVDDGFVVSLNHAISPYL